MAPRAARLGAARRGARGGRRPSGGSAIPPPTCAGPGRCEPGGGGRRGAAGPPAAGRAALRGRRGKPRGAGVRGPPRAAGSARAALRADGSGARRGAGEPPAAPGSAAPARPAAASAGARGGCGSAPGLPPGRAAGLRSGEARESASGARKPLGGETQRQPPGGAQVAGGRTPAGPSPAGAAGSRCRRRAHTHVRGMPGAARPPRAGPAGQQRAAAGSAPTWRGSPGACSPRPEETKPRLARAGDARGALPFLKLFIYLFTYFLFPCPSAPASSLPLRRGAVVISGREGGGAACLFVCTACWLPPCDKR